MPAVDPVVDPTVVFVLGSGCGGSSGGRVGMRNGLKEVDGGIGGCEVCDDREGGTVACEGGASCRSDEGCGVGVADCEIMASSGAGVLETPDTRDVVLSQFPSTSSG